MLHRALLGSLERFFGCLIEHYGGAFPVWLSPVQAIVLNVTEKSEAYGKKVFERLRESGYRVEFDSRNETLGHKIREARLRKIPYIIVVGDKEAANSTLAPRSRKREFCPKPRFRISLKFLKAKTGRSLKSRPIHRRWAYSIPPREALKRRNQVKQVHKGVRGKGHRRRRNSIRGAPDSRRLKGGGRSRGWIWSRCRPTRSRPYVR